MTNFSRQHIKFGFTERKTFYTDSTKKALKLRFRARKDPLDKSGIPYVVHTFHLAEQMEDEDADKKVNLADLRFNCDHARPDMLDDKMLRDTKNTKKP